MRVAINRGSKIFPAVPGGFGITERVLVYWQYIHGADATFICKSTELSEDTVAAYTRTCRRICAWDALRRQNEMVFGEQGDICVDVEVDEHEWRHWNVGNIHYFWVWIGVTQRGSHMLYLAPLRSSDPRMPLGITHSTDEARVPPLTSECLAETFQVAGFNAKTNANIHADTAKAYQVLVVVVAVSGGGSLRRNSTCRSLKASNLGTEIRVPTSR